MSKEPEESKKENSKQVISTYPHPPNLKNENFSFFGLFSNGQTYKQQENYYSYLAKASCFIASIYPMKVGQSQDLSQW